MPLDDGGHPSLRHFAYREMADPGNGGIQARFGNPKFQRLLSHVFKSKRLVLTPSDVAFVELVTAATLSRQTLATFPNAEGYYRLRLAFAKTKMGRHRAVTSGPNEKPMSFFMGTRYDVPFRKLLTCHHVR